MADKLLDLGAILGESVLAGWDSGTPDPGVAFLQGKATSVFAAGEQALDKVTNITNSVANQISNASALHDSFSEQGKQLKDAISNIDYEEYGRVIYDTTIDILKKEVWEYAKQRIKDVKEDVENAATSYLAQRTAYWTGVYSKGAVSEILADMMSPVDTKMQKEAEDKTNNAFKERVAQIKEKAAAVTQVVDSTISMAQEAISSTLTYIQAGPKFIETNLNKYLKLTINPVKEQIDEQLGEMINDVYGAADENAEQLGKAAGDKVTEKLKSIAEKQKAKIEKAKVTVVSFAKGLLDLVKKKALALIGG